MSGWTRYPRPLTHGKFNEDIDLIIELIGTHLYTWRVDAGGQVWIKRHSS
jgi:hypothetical protein